MRATVSTKRSASLSRMLEIAADEPLDRVGHLLRANDAPDHLAERRARAGARSPWLPPISIW